MIIITLQNINANKLHDELISAEIIPVLVESVGNITHITFRAEEDMQLVQQIIDTHDTIPAQPQPTVEDFNLEVDYRVTILEMIGEI